MKPIYKPKGAALEYCDLTLNIYDSCNYGCAYCFSLDRAKRFGKPWGNEVRPRFVLWNPQRSSCDICAVAIT